LRPLLTVTLESQPLESVAADVLVVGVGLDDRPLRGAAGYADWRLCGQLRDLVASGRISGAHGQAALVIAGVGLRTRRLLILGLGTRSALDVSQWQALGHDAIDRSIRLCAKTVALGIAQDACIDSDPALDGTADAVAGLISGAADAVLASGVELDVALLGTSLAIPPETRIPAGVEVRLPGSAISNEQPQAV
jgi:hypothetical protein